MKVKELIEELKKVDGELDVFTKKYDLGSIGNIFFVTKDKYSSFGHVENCILLTDYDKSQDD